MFTGIIETTATVESLQRLQSEWRLVVGSGELDLADLQIGDSIAVSGCCLTVVELSVDSFAADVSGETMNCTILGSLKPGSKVNLEKAMLATSRFGGHIVSGHVDGVGKLVGSTADGGSIRMEFDAPIALAKYIAAKGSICIDGASLTVNEVSGATFTINVIPHTQTETTIGDYVVGRGVNLEVDLVARYLERLMQKL
ncbi:MAG TPA: riboflavin synthase [Gammaproteobacteria bacterium]|jgi:riboflavin synthase|nr:riboflavin synthase [Gammaproteobacteria bacterium]HIL63561.1 riboflavin synthase [Porticoccaceae bacterium]